MAAVTTERFLVTESTPVKIIKGPSSLSTTSLVHSDNLIYLGGNNNVTVATGYPIGGADIPLFPLTLGSATSPNDVWAITAAGTTSLVAVLTVKNDS